LTRIQFFKKTEKPKQRSFEDTAKKFEFQKVSNSAWISNLLPNELLLCIFRFLSYDEILKLRVLCKAANEMLGNSLFWKNICGVTTEQQFGLHITLFYDNLTNMDWFLFFRTKIFPLICQKRKMTEISDAKIGTFLRLKEVEEGSIPVCSS
jgi:hypothetical protein